MESNIIEWVNPHKLWFDELWVNETEAPIENRDNDFEGGGDDGKEILEQEELR